jgi:hypothetical protein
VTARTSSRSRLYTNSCSGRPYEFCEKERMNICETTFLYAYLHEVQEVICGCENLLRVADNVVGIWLQPGCLSRRVRVNVLRAEPQ